MVSPWWDSGIQHSALGPLGLDHLGWVQAVVDTVIDTVVDTVVGGSSWG